MRKSSHGFAMHSIAPVEPHDLHWLNEDVVWTMGRILSFIFSFFRFIIAFHQFKKIDNKRK